LQRYTALALLGIATADMNEPERTDEERAPDPGKVDSRRNLDAVSRLRKRGKTVEQAVAFVDRPVAEWTSGDLARLSEWSKPPAKSAPSGERGADGKLADHAFDCGAQTGEPCDRGCNGQ